MKLTAHLHLAPRLRMRGAIPPLLPHIFMALYLVKQRDNFNILIYFMDFNIHDEIKT
jgi:hypothetical protein